MKTNSMKVKAFRQKEARRAFLWVCQNPAKWDEIIAPDQTIVSNRHLAELLQELIQQELYQLACLAVYRCAEIFRTDEIYAAWYNKVEELFTEDELIYVLYDIIERLSAEDNKRLKG